MDRAHQSFSLKEKHEAMCLIDHLIMNGVSCAAACQQFGILPLYYHCWHETITKVDELEEDSGFVAFNMNGSAWKINPGCSGLLGPPRK